MSMTQVWERLFIGSFADAESLIVANPQAIDTVVTLSLAPMRKKQRGVNYLHFPVEDAQFIQGGAFDGIMDAIGENIRWGRVLVHCGESISRSPIMVAAYLHSVGYKNIDAALDEIAKLRPIVAPSNVLLDSVRKHIR